MTNMKIPKQIPDEVTLDEMLSRPTTDLNNFIKELDGDIMILGAGGKMGVTLAMMANRAIRETGLGKKVIAVDRFDDRTALVLLEKAGVKTLTCDLLNREEVSKLPEVLNIIYMVGKKFGTENDTELTWAINVLAPEHVAAHFRKSRIVVFSTGCVYPLVRPSEGGSLEDTPPAPVGEYAQSCLGRERVFSYYNKNSGTKTCLFRLNYSIDLRYGVLYDIGIKVYNSKPVELAVSHFNCIWQGDASRLALLCLGQCSSPPTILNITGPETISVKETAKKFARYFNKEVEFLGEVPNSTMYLSNASRSFEIFGKPVVPAEKMIEWQAQWIEQGGRSLNKPTHFEVTSGQY